MQKDFLDKFYCWNYLRMIIHGCWTWEHFFSPCTNFPAKWRPRQSCRHESPTRWHRHQAWRDIKRGTSAADLFNIKRMQCNFSHASVRMTSSISNAYYAMFQTQQSKSRRTLVSSVRSSNSHPDLLVIHPPPPTHFFRSHRSSTLDFHFLSQ